MASYPVTVRRGEVNVVMYFGQEAIKKTLQTRQTALLEVRRIEQARDTFRQKFGRLPESLAELQAKGLLNPPATDPYGGEFYLEPDGTVRTTSKFAAPPPPKK